MSERATTWRDVLEGAEGAAIMLFDLLTPFLEPRRSHWGLSEEEAERAYPGDERVPEPRWSWTHGVEIDAPPEAVWPWVIQISADRAGFYSYEALENLMGCKLHNADSIHPEWALKVGDALLMHPKVPPLPVVALEPPRYWQCWGAPDERARSEGRPWVTASWLFFLEPLPEGRTRFISRFRSDCSDDLPTRLASDVYPIEALGFAMDRKMLLGVKARAEQAE